MRILFMGTPDIAAECLKALYAAGFENNVPERLSNGR